MDNVNVPELRAAVVICTLARPCAIRRACEAILRERPRASIFVIDASDDAKTEATCSSVADRHRQAAVHYRRAMRPGLARQRNQAVTELARLPYDVVHFLDDDIEVLPGYFDAVERAFADGEEIGGVGGWIVNMPDERYPRINRLLFLSGPRAHSILRSGRVVVPASRGGKEKPLCEPVMWLQGGTMSYRMEVLRNTAFDDRLTGYSHGEDRDFSCRVTLRWRLLVAKEARCLHHGTIGKPQDSRSYGRMRTGIDYQWVKERKVDGFKFSRVAFIWSAVGEVASYVVVRVFGVKMRYDPGAYAIGVVQGLWDIVCRRYPLDSRAAPGMAVGVDAKRSI